MKIIFYYVLFPLYRPFYLLALIINTFLLGSLIILISPLDRRGNGVHYVGKFWAWLNIFLSGTRVKVRGREHLAPLQNYIVMSNHQSLFDVWALIAYLPLQLRWIIKKDIRRVPVFGYALERMGHIYVDRNRGDNVRRSIEKAAQKVREKTSVVFFPEGTRSEDGRLLKFRKGGFILAQKTGYPILPISINGSRFVLPKNTLGLMPGRIELVLSAPIKKPEGIVTGDLMKQVETSIEKGLDLQFGRLT
jgi:1-acyl-sn-glycerol-3-phosphate acyltransferase